MVEITETMKESRKSHIQAIEERIDGCIKRAVELGKHSCLFNCSKDNDCDKPFYDEIRRKYEEAGYTIKPTGYIGGVLQTTEEMFW